LANRLKLAIAEAGRDISARLFFIMRGDDFEYALQNTRVILAPEQRIATFGTTQFEFYLLTESMDEVNVVRVRNGTMHAERPQILTMDHLRELAMEGFNEEAGEYLEYLRQVSPELALLRYGFQLRKTNFSEETVHDSLEAVTDRVVQRVRSSEAGTGAVLQGIDEGWEVSLLRLTADLIQHSVQRNLGDWKRNGLLP